jgi:DegV family protein with EDD domain
MAPVAIVTDTCHYLPRELVAEHELHEVSLYVHWDGRADREGDLPGFDAYYAYLRTASEVPTTSQPSVGDFLAAYEPLLDAGRDVVSVHLASGLSGTYQSALQARDALKERADRVHVVDSATACGGEGFCVLAASAASRRGLDAAAVADHVRRTRERLRMYFSIDTLEFLRKGGRIGGAQAWLGSALKIKPILTVESEITPIERVRTSGRAFERMVGLLQERKDAGADAWMVQHIQAPDVAARLVERGREIFGTEPIVLSEIGPVIGTHVGPGLLGAGGVPSSFLTP